MIISRPNLTIFTKRWMGFCEAASRPNSKIFGRITVDGHLTSRFHPTYQFPTAHQKSAIERRRSAFQGQIRSDPPRSRDHKGGRKTMRSLSECPSLIGDRLKLTSSPFRECEIQGWESRQKRSDAIPVAPQRGVIAGDFPSSFSPCFWRNNSE
jgi:hypothetical protein